MELLHECQNEMIEYEFCQLEKKQNNCKAISFDIYHLHKIIETIVFRNFLFDSLHVLIRMQQTKLDSNLLFCSKCFRNNVKVTRVFVV